MVNSHIEMHQSRVHMISVVGKCNVYVMMCDKDVQDCGCDDTCASNSIALI